MRDRLVGGIRAPGKGKAASASYCARIRIVYLEAPWAEIRRRNHVRDVPVPEPVLRRMAARLEVPEPAEAHEVTYVVA